MPNVNDGRRPYRSAVRAVAADRTRRAVVAAARTLFLDRGYTATSLRDVAERAGVARPTVTAAFGSKAALLRRVVDEALAGDDEPVPVAERPWFAPVWKARSAPAVLTAYADVCVLIAERAGGIFEVVHRASGDAGEVADLWENMCRNRRAGADMVVRRAAECGPLRDDLAHDQIVDGLWTLNDPTLHVGLVTRRGWTKARYTHWLAQQMHTAVLGRAGPR